MKIIATDRNGAEQIVEGRDGWTVMEVLRDAGLPIAAECGGACACATCHVYVDATWRDAIGTPVPGSQEASMLSFAAVTQPDSRLSCQIPVTEALDGLILRMPEGQH